MMLLWVMNGCGQIAPNLHKQQQNENYNQENNEVEDPQNNQVTHNIYNGHTIYDDPNKRGSTTLPKNPSLMEDTITINEENSGSGNKIITNNSSSGNLKTYNSSLQGFRSIYFGFGEYGISSKMQENMVNNIETATNTTTTIKIEGNCDEFGTDEYNYALGLKRAKSVKDSLVSQGVDGSKIVVTSYGESSPVCTEFSDSCYDRNRRVDLRLAN